MDARDLKPTPLKKIFWIVDGVVKQEIQKDSPVGIRVANWMKNKLKNTTHRTGKLLVVPADAKPEDYNDKQLNLNLC